jgi:hypothetical protein
MSNIYTAQFYFSGLYGNYTINQKTSQFFPGSLPDFLEDFQIVLNLCAFVFQFSQKNNLFHHWTLYNDGHRNLIILLFRTIWKLYN